MHGVIGVITCQVLEEELAYLFLHDSEIKKVSIVRSDYSDGMEEGLRRCQEWSILNDYSEFKPQVGTGIELLVEVLHVGLHMRKQELLEGVANKLMTMQEHCDVILLGYGLCGNALEKLEESVTDLQIPVIMPTNSDGSRIDDCVCLVLGGTRYYLEEVRKVAGTWFTTPGWLKHWETLLLKELGAPDVKTAKWIFDKAGYQRVLMVNTHIADDTKFRQEALAFSKIFNFRLEERDGSLDILKQALQQAKKLARGDEI